MKQPKFNNYFQVQSQQTAQNQNIKSNQSSDQIKSPQNMRNQQQTQHSLKVPYQNPFHYSKQKAQSDKENDCSSLPKSEQRKVMISNPYQAHQNSGSQSQQPLSSYYQGQNTLRENQNQINAGSNGQNRSQLQQIFYQQPQVQKVFDYQSQSSQQNISLNEPKIMMSGSVIAQNNHVDRQNLAFALRQQNTQQKSFSHEYLQLQSQEMELQIRRKFKPQLLDQFIIKGQ
eukprot:403357201